MFEEYIKYATNKIRLPKEIRTNKETAKKYIYYLVNNNININNPDIHVLSNWVNMSDKLLSINNDNESIVNHAKIKSISFLNEKQVVGDFTVPDGHSYTANGVVVHNCNLPETATKEIVSDVYMAAWKSGCKGFTVYRDKSRDGVLINTADAKRDKVKDGRPTDIETVMAPKRPNELPCDIKKVKINGEVWTLFVGLFNDKPYEIFGGLSKYVDIPNKNKTGRIVKNGKVDGLSTYNLKIGEGEDEMVIKDIANVFENANFGAFTRTISLSLRHGIPVQYVAEQLLKDKNSDIISFSKVMARVLKGYIKDGVKSAGTKCTECKAEGSMMYQEGCLKCNNCGYSKCG